MATVTWQVRFRTLGLLDRRRISPMMGLNLGPSGTLGLPQARSVVIRAFGVLVSLFFCFTSRKAFWAILAKRKPGHAITTDCTTVGGQVSS